MWSLSDQPRRPLRDAWPSNAPSAGWNEHTFPANLPGHSGFARNVGQWTVT